MNWYGDQKGEGFEYHILVVAIRIALIIKGAAGGQPIVPLAKGSARQVINRFKQNRNDIIKNLPPPLFDKEGFPSLWKREGRRDFMK